MASTTEGNTRTALRQSELFETLTDAELDIILPFCSLRNHEAGEVLVRQGDRHNFLYVIKEGQLAVLRTIGNRRPDERNEITVQVLGSGRACSWGALVAPYISAASVKTLIKSEVVAVNAESLRRVMERHYAIDHAITKKLAEIIGERLRRLYAAADTYL